MQQPLEQSHLHTVGELIVATGEVSPETSVTAVYDLFTASPALEALAVVSNDEPAALITRTKLLFLLSRRFGYELHGRSAIVSVADRTPLIVREEELLDTVIEKACARPPQDVYDEIIVIDETGKYLGLLSLKELVIQQSVALTRSVLLQELASARNEELERVNKVKSHFLANVTHELRSPVNAILGLAHLLKMAAEKDAMDDIRERLGFLMSTAANLRTVITNILDMSKIEAGRMEVSLKEVDLIPLLAEVAETTRILIREKPVTVVLGTTVGRIAVTTDLIKVRQILTNLAGNAAKFTDTGSIEFRVAVREERVEVAVIDTGIGIRDEDLHVLFSSFGQVEDATIKSREGTGLGLAISDNLAKLLGGSISISSRYGEGSTFTLSLPRNLKGEI